MANTQTLWWGKHPLNVQPRSEWEVSGWSYTCWSCWRVSNLIWRHRREHSYRSCIQSKSRGLLFYLQMSDHDCQTMPEDYGKFQSPEQKHLWCLEHKGTFIKREFLFLDKRFSKVLRTKSCYHLITTTLLIIQLYLFLSKLQQRV